MKMTIKSSVLAVAIAFIFAAASVYAEPSPASGGPSSDNPGTPAKPGSPGDKPKVPDVPASPTVPNIPNASDQPTVVPTKPGSPAEKPSPENPSAPK
jgi:hypothetical protein